MDFVQKEVLHKNIVSNNIILGVDKTLMVNQSNVMLKRWYKVALKRLLFSSLKLDSLMDLYYTLIGKTFHIGGMAYSNDDVGYLYKKGVCSDDYISFHLNRDGEDLGQVSFYYDRHIEKYHSFEVLNYAATVLTLPIRNSIRFLSSRKSDSHDLVSGLGNIRSFGLSLRSEVKLARERYSPLSVVMFELRDNKFQKKLTESISACQIERFIGGIMKDSVPSSNQLYALSDNRYAIILPLSVIFRAHRFAEYVRTRVIYKAYTESERSLHLGFCGGVTEYKCGEDISTLLTRLDHALSQGKVYTVNPIYAIDQNGRCIKC